MRHRQPLSQARDNGHRGVCKCCRQPLGEDRYGDCDECKTMLTCVSDLRRVALGPVSPEHEARIERYAAIVAAGGRLFE